MKYSNITVLLLVLLVSSCTTMMAHKVNRDREKHGECSPPEQSRCIDLVKTAVADIATAAKVADEVIGQMPRHSQVPNIGTGDAQCVATEEKVCSVSFGCECRLKTTGAESP